MDVIEPPLDDLGLPTEGLVELCDWLLEPDYHHEQNLDPSPSIQEETQASGADVNNTGADVHNTSTFRCIDPGHGECCCRCVRTCSAATCASIVLQPSHIHTHCEECEVAAESRPIASSASLRPSALSCLYC